MIVVYHKVGGVWFVICCESVIRGQLACCHGVAPGIEQGCGLKNETGERLR